MREIIIKYFLNLNTVGFTYYKASQLSQLSDEELLDEYTRVIYDNGHADGVDYAMEK